MKNFVNKHQNLLLLLGFIPTATFLHLIFKGVFSIWNPTLSIIHFGLFLIQMIPFVLVTTLSTEYKVNYLKPFKKLFFWIKLFICSKIYSKYYYLTDDYGECLQECPIKTKSEYGFIRMVGSMGCKEDCKNCIASDHFTNNSYIKCKHVSKRKFNFFSWIKKLFTLLLICTLLSSCSVYIKCNINKPLQNNTSQQDSTQIETQYWF